LDIAQASRVQTSVRKGLSYLIAGQQADGGWVAFDKSHPAITALVVNALANDPDFGPNHPAVQRGLEYILRFVQPDGGIYVDGEEMPNYHTSVALMALASLKDPAQARRISDAQSFLKRLQWDEGEGHETSSAWYGGAGYGKSERPDLSNTQLMLEALQQSGLSASDPVYQKAMVFVGRCQMLGETNDQQYARESVDGGFIYSAANGGESKAGTVVAGERPQLRSYGSMTYAGFKSLLYARVDRSDRRVQAAVSWIRKHYTLDANPNMPGEQSKEGLYYYHHVFARALHAWGEDTIIDIKNIPHPWRTELGEKLISLQREDGSWVNDADRWYEGNPHLVTAYAVLALQTTLEAKSDG
jgi:squalene-hopene/tetraprenyl-beta-curcumene cyclase